MDSIVIRGGRPLHGRISVGGAKNAALPLMAACLLTDEVLTLTNLPHLADIVTMANLLQQLGVQMHLNGHDAAEAGHTGRVVDLHAATIASTTAPYELVRKMRASVLVLGPLVARTGEARVSLPGGCAIGTRPIDLHLMGLEAMGAEIALDGGYVTARAPRGLKGADIVFPKVSVGATENLLMAAALADGETILRNAAREPEIADLALCLQSMGAEIHGIGSDTLRVVGKPRLHAARHAVMPDRIEAGTYAMAAAITGGELEIVGARAETLDSLSHVMERAGVVFEPRDSGILVRRANGHLEGVDVMTEPFPGFPTDLQAQLMAMLTVARGASMITEQIFENRFMHVPELTRMGANITVHGSSALVRGQESLKGAPVMATDLRASVSLVLAGLAAEGETSVDRVYHLDRGYERLEEKLSACGADIHRVRRNSDA